MCTRKIKSKLFQMLCNVYTYKQTNDTTGRHMKNICFGLWLHQAAFIWLFAFTQDTTHTDSQGKRNKRYLFVYFIVTFFIRAVLPLLDFSSYPTHKSQRQDFSTLCSILITINFPSKISRVSLWLHSKFITSAI